MSSASRDSLSKSPLWVSASEIYSYAHGLLTEFPEEEKWSMASRLRNHAFDLTDNVAVADGSKDPRDQMHYYRKAISSLYGLKNCLTMAKRAGYFTLEPEMMLTIEKLIDNTTKREQEAIDNIQEYLKIFEKQEARPKGVKK